MLDACYDDQPGPFALRQLMQKSYDVHFGSALLRRGSSLEVGTASSVMANLQTDGTYMLIMDGHAVGLFCESHTIFIADPAFRRVLVGSIPVILREIGNHDEVLLLPVFFGDGVQEEGRVSADDAGVRV